MKLSKRSGFLASCLIAGTVSSQDLPTEPPFIVEEVMETVVTGAGDGLFTDWRVAPKPIVTPGGAIVFAARNLDLPHPARGLYRKAGGAAGYETIFQAEDPAPFDFPPGYGLLSPEQIQYAVAPDDTVVGTIFYAHPDPSEESGMALLVKEPFGPLFTAARTSDVAFNLNGEPPIYFQQPQVQVASADGKLVYAFVAVYHDFNTNMTHDRVYLVKGIEDPYLVVETGDALPGALSPAQFHPGVFTDYPEDRSRLALGERGDVVFTPSHRENEIWAWRFATRTIEKVLVRGDPLPGGGQGSVQDVGSFAMNAAGTLAVTTLNSTFRSSLWRIESDGSRTILARDGDTIDVAGGGQATGIFLSGDAAINSQGHIAFTVSPAGGDFAYPLVLVRESIDTYRAAVRGPSAPQFPGLTIGSVQDLQLGDKGAVLFSDNTGAITLWAAALNGPPRLLARLFPSHFRIGRDGDGAPITRRAQGWRAGIGGDSEVALGVSYTDDGGDNGLFRISFLPKSLLVNSTGGGGDATPGDDACDTGSTVLDREGRTVPECTLRAAIQEANAKPDRTTIHFAIAGDGPHVIAIEPMEILHPAEIDGSTQPGGGLGHPEIVLEGNDALPGLHLSGGQSLLRGLVFIRFDDEAIRITGPGESRIEGCWLGLDTRLFPAGNPGFGVLIESSPRNQVGGRELAQSNVFVRCGQDGAYPCAVMVRGAGSTGNRIQGNYIGMTDLPWDGDRLPAGNTNGVCIVGASENLVGGSPEESNTFVNNVFAGIRVEKGMEEARGNVLEQNVIFQLDEGRPGPPLQVGILVQDAFETEIISQLVAGQTKHGISILGLTEEALATVVKSSTVGYSPEEAADVAGNGEAGIFIQNASKNTVGGAGPLDFNVVSGNGGPNILIEGPRAKENLLRENRIGTDRAGQLLDIPPHILALVTPRGEGVLIQGGASRNTLDGNTVSDNARSGVAIVSERNAEPALQCTENVLTVNWIGIGDDGLPLPNGGDGVLIEESPRNEIGDALEGNVISANVGSGVSIRGALSRENLVIENRIGTDPHGARPHGNGDDGVSISDGARDNLIGDALLGNVISGNVKAGVGISPGRAQGGLAPRVPTGNSVKANLIGLDATGSAPVPNSEDGVMIADCDNNLVGGPAPADGNTISGNLWNGVVVKGKDAFLNTIQGNYIGTDLRGEVAIGNTLDGVKVISATQTLVGGPAPMPGVAPGNLISGNGFYGVSVEEPGEEPADLNTWITGNTIGRSALGAVLSNQLGGVEVLDAHSNLIGPDNVIAANSGPGVLVWESPGATAHGNTITENGITGNAGPGIDLAADGPTPNDAGDADLGPNRLQNHPVLTVSGGATPVVRARLSSEPGKTYTIEVFEDGLPVPLNPPEGAIFLGAAALTTDAQGEGSVEIPGLPPAVCYTGTATEDESGDTSEFSPCADVDPPDPEAADFGDAPQSYGTFLADDGARHLPSPGFLLGGIVDFEMQGQPSADASGDDSGNLDDEDGVTLPEALAPGTAAPATIAASLEGHVDAWIDFGGDGRFDEPGDRVLSSVAVVGTGPNAVELAVPAGAAPGLTHARFRLSRAGGLGPKGQAPDGEVEDYRVRIEAGAAIFRRGDSNDDGRVDISDAVFTLNHLFIEAKPIACEAALDGNDDEKVDISDPISVLNALFLGTSEVPSPGIESCGSDPTPGDLGCGPTRC